MKSLGTAVLFLGLVILHIWMGRIESPISYVSPLFGGLLLGAYVWGLSGWNKPFVTKDPEGKLIPNGLKVTFVLVTFFLYICSFVDRG
jgi:hypothetical protein